jgi:thioesterase domain-containing protein
MGLRRQIQYVREKADVLWNGREKSLLEMLEVHVSSGPLANRAQVSETNLKAMREHKGMRYPGRLTLFRAMEPLKGTVPDRYMGWSTLADELEVYDVPTTHAAILHEPHVKTLAENLRKAMDSTAHSTRRRIRAARR